MEEVLVFLFLLTSSLSGKLIREKTLDLCLRSAAAAAVEVLDIGSVDGLDDDPDR